ncbi:ATP-binding protein [Streptomyces sp. RKND-216]|uniref:ATP-binding protein n=1 Tax=Streptomyces sp. RKND-216 TaxID=2562581 RepID=UPI00109DE3C2|nr:ATP-binding protein [Streptomyces sp. RKND-216]THA25076.1 ATP-binding protein [Streptomyces sp. RKND-216]
MHSATLGDVSAEKTHPERQFSVLLSPTRRGARLARLLTVAHLASWGLPSDAAAHVVAELAANAALHGRVPGRDFRLTLTAGADGRLRVEVADTRGERLPTGGRRAPDDDSETGRGMLIVQALADTWGVETGPLPRKTVWAEFTFPR